MIDTELEVELELIRLYKAIEHIDTKIAEFNKHKDDVEASTSFKYVVGVIIYELKEVRTILIGE